MSRDSVPLPSLRMPQTRLLSSTTAAAFSLQWACSSFASRALPENTSPLAVDKGTDPPLLELQHQDATLSSSSTTTSSSRHPVPSSCFVPSSPPPTRQIQTQPPSRPWNRVCRVPSRSSLADLDPDVAFKPNGRSTRLPLLLLNYGNNNNSSSSPPSPIPKDESQAGKEEEEEVGHDDDDDCYNDDSHSQSHCIEVGSCYVPVVQNTVRVTCDTCWRQFLLTSKDPCRLERHQQNFCRTRTQRRVQRWWSEIQAFADRVQNRVALTRGGRRRCRLSEGQNDDEEVEEEEVKAIEGSREADPLGQGRGREWGRGRGLVCGYYAGKKISKKNREKMKREAEALEKKEWRSSEVEDQDG